MTWWYLWREGIPPESFSSSGVFFSYSDACPSVPHPTTRVERGKERKPRARVSHTGFHGTPILWVLIDDIQKGVCLRTGGLNKEKGLLWHLRASVFSGGLTDFITGGKSMVVFPKLIWNGTLLWGTGIMLRNRYRRPRCPRPYSQIYSYELSCLDQILFRIMVRVSPSLRLLSVFVSWFCDSVFLLPLWDSYCRQIRAACPPLLLSCTDKCLGRMKDRALTCASGLGRTYILHPTTSRGCLHLGFLDCLMQATWVNTPPGDWKREEGPAGKGLEGHAKEYGLSAAGREGWVLEGVIRSSWVGIKRS